MANTEPRTTQQPDTSEKRGGHTSKPDPVEKLPKVSDRPGAGASTSGNGGGKSPSK